MTPPRTHEENRSKVCVLCLKKSNLRQISEKTVLLVKNRFLPDIDVRSGYYPKQICCRCSFAINENQNVEVHKYKNFQRVSTRSGMLCKCDVCVAARVTLTQFGGYQINNSKKRGRPSVSENSKKVRTAKLCTICYSELSKGKRHSCTRVERQQNLLQMVTGDRPRSGDSVVAAYLKENRDSDGSIALANIRGRPSHWVTGSAVSRSTKVLSMDDMFLIKNICDLSTRKTLRLSSALRGMDIEVPSNLPQQITNANQMLKEFFSITRISFDLEKEKKNPQACASTKPAVYCNDVKALIQFILTVRSLSLADVFFKIGADGGGGSFKITLSIVEKNQRNEKGGKDTGVKKLLLLAVVPGITEKYTNIAKVWSTLLKLNELEAVVAGDLKIVNLLLGLMGHSSSHPCPYCCTSKSKLSQECMIPRTLGLIRTNYGKWEDDGADDKRAKNFYNCVQYPLLCGSPDQTTVMLCPPPVLHIVLGIINAVYKAVETADPATAEQWVKVSSCQRHSKYGFTGRHCHKLLDKRTMLEFDGPLGMFRSVRMY